MMPNEDELILIATLKCVAHVDAVEQSEHVAPAGVLDSSTLVSLDVAGRPILLETMGAREVDAGGGNISKTAATSLLMIWRAQT